MMIQDQRGRGALESAVQHLMQSAAQSPDVVGLFSLFNTRTPRVYADIDRVQSEILGVPASRVFETLRSISVRRSSTSSTCWAERFA